MAHASVGDICITGRFNRLALVIFRRDPSEGRPEDVRIVPLAVAAFAPPATEREVLIPASATHLGQALLAESWNARSLLSDILSIPIGHAESRVVDAVRAAEMVGIAPGVDVTPYADLIGVKRVAAQELAAIAGFENAEVEAWNAIEAACLEITPAPREACVYAREAYKPRTQVGVAFGFGRTTVNVMPSIELLTMAYPPVATPQWALAGSMSEYDAMAMGAAA